MRNGEICELFLENDTDTYLVELHALTANGVEYNRIQTRFNDFRAGAMMWGNVKDGHGFIRWELVESLCSAPEFMPAGVELTLDEMC